MILRQLGCFFFRPILITKNAWSNAPESYSPPAKRAVVDLLTAASTKDSEVHLSRSAASPSMR